MRKLALALHCGANIATRDEVESAPTPESTDTWHPIPHRNLIDMLRERLPNYGMEIVQEAHGMYKGGDRYFGMFQVAGGDGGALADDVGLVFGLRNSHDKSFPAGLCLGSGVFVCDNLSFSAEIVIGRRHTKNIMRDLPNLVTMAVGKLMQARIDQTRRLEVYKKTLLSDRGAHDLIVQALRSGAINTTRLPKVVEQWHKPAHKEFDKRNVWRLFNGFTQVYKSTPLIQLPTRTTRLHGLLDSACGLMSAAKAKTDLQSVYENHPDVLIA